jgi:hypothetical protein
MLDRVAHVVDDMIASERDLGTESDFFDQGALNVDGRDTQICSAQIYSNGEFIHDGSL